MSQRRVAPRASKRTGTTRSRGGSAIYIIAMGNRAIRLAKGRSCVFISIFSQVAFSLGTKGKHTVTALMGNARTRFSRPLGGKSQMRVC